MKIVITRTRFGPQRGLRWRFVASNGRTLAHGGQGYTRRIDMTAALCMVTGGTLTDDGTLLYRPSGAVPVEDRTR